MRTANTPAFSSGASSMLAISPAANTFGSVTVCSVALTRMKPPASSASPLPASHGAPPAWVTHTTSSASSDSPEAVCSRPFDTCVTGAPRCRAMPRCASTRSNARRTAALCVGRIRGPPSSRWKRSSPGSRPSARNSFSRRYCMASVNSTPPAPAPTSAMLVRPACPRTRSSSASQRPLKVLMGFTGTANSSAPAAWLVRGVEPMLIDSWS